VSEKHEMAVRLCPSAQIAGVVQEQNVSLPTRRPWVRIPSPAPLRGRLTVGQRPLESLIQVRILASQHHAEVAELVDARDLKSLDSQLSCGSESRPRHRRVAQLVKRAWFGTMRSRVRVPPLRPDHKMQTIIFSPKFSNEFNLLLNFYYIWWQEKQKLEEKEKIKTKGGIEALAFIYEQIRNAIEYKGENLLRRYAIERILRRYSWINSSWDYQKIGESLIKELVWARYLKEEEVPVEKANEVEKILKNFFPFLNFSQEKEWKDWIFTLTSCEIENCLSSHIIDKGYIEVISQLIKNNYSFVGLSEEETDIQTFLAVGRAFLKLDDSTLSWYLFKREYSCVGSPQDLLKAKEKITSELNHPLRLSLFRFSRRVLAQFFVLKEIIEKNFPNKINSIFESPEKLEEEIKEICEKKYKETKEKIARGIIRSIIYIFATKVLIALLLEIPYELFFFKKINFLPIGINIIIPPTLMLALGSTIKVPGEENTKKIIKEINTFIYQKDSSGKITIFLSQKQKNSFLQKIFTFFYVLLFALIFGGLTYFLVKLKFNIVSLGVFFIFLSLVLLFGFRVRYNASEVFTVEEKERFLLRLLDNLSLPFLNLGFWLSKSLAKLNVLMIVMDFMIEAPLKSIIRVFEEWLNFIKEKRKEVIEVPFSP
jgi:hypothetical protein